jgi:competence protein ComEA
MRKHELIAQENAIGFTFKAGRVMTPPAFVLVFPGRRDSGPGLLKCVPSVRRTLNKDKESPMRKLVTTFCLLMTCWLATPALADDVMPAASGAEVSVNINTAGPDEIAEVLQGVGQAKAQAIVDYREQNGAFTSVEALTSVKGIGPSTLANNSDRIKLQ